MKTRLSIGSLLNVVLFGSALMVTASSCGTSNDANTQGRGYTLDNICQRSAAELCPMVKPCCESSGLVFFLQGCEAEELEGCGEMVERVKAGGLTFDVEAAEACMSQATSLFQKCQLTTDEDLAAWAEWRASCSSVFTGTRAEGESCTGVLDCVQPANENERADCRNNKCVISTARVGEGEACSRSQFIECEEGLFCRTPSPGHPDGVCEKLRAIGEPCDFPYQCESGGFCDGYASACAPKKAVGEACVSTLECGIHWCIEGKCAAKSMVDDASCNGGWGSQDPDPPKDFPPPF